MTHTDLERGLGFLKESRYSEAEQLFRRVVQADEHHQVAWDRLGWALANQGRFEDAKRCVERAVEEATKKSRGGGRRYDLGRFFTTLGAVRCLAGQAESALRALESADPSNWYCMYWKARAHMALGHAREALSLAREAQTRAPKPLLPPLSDEIRKMIDECESRVGT